MSAPLVIHFVDLHVDFLWQLCHQQGAQHTGQHGKTKNDSKLAVTFDAAGCTVLRNKPEKILAIGELDNFD
uniref:Uncharacterized protein n=1 Tax=Romanomermis culicivorax TaxID=13658 RepID=A0A915HYL8_ROMCU